MRSVKLFSYLTCTLIFALLLLTIVSFLNHKFEQHDMYIYGWGYLSPVGRKPVRTSTAVRIGDLSSGNVLLYRDEDRSATRSTDDLGFRSSPKCQNAADVLIIGDSTVDSAIYDDRETISWQISELANVSVINAGGGYDIGKILNYFGADQFRIVIEFMTERNIGNRMSSDSNTDTQTASIWNLDNMNQWSVINKAFRYLRGLEEDIRSLYFSDIPIPKYQFFNHRMDDTDLQFAIAKISNRAERFDSMGIVYVFVPVPAKQTIYGRENGLEIDEFTYTYLELLHEKLRRMGVDTIDLMPSLRSERTKSVFFRADTHWNPHGIRISAQTVVDGLREMGLNLGLQFCKK